MQDKKCKWKLRLKIGRNKQMERNIRNGIKSTRNEKLSWMENFVMVEEWRSSRHLEEEDSKISDEKNRHLNHILRKTLKHSFFTQNKV